MASEHAKDGRAFFYGTLMVPAVLHRVCPGSTFTESGAPDTHLLKARPAILHNHRRQRVKGADYPAVLPVRDATVRGTFVSGLIRADLARLDIFEGSEYNREVVKVRLLTEVGDESGKGNVEADEVEAETYIWIAGEGRLEDREWDFAEFQREKMKYWTGEEGESEYAEVDETVAEAQRDGTGGRGANGHITNALKEEHTRDEIIRNAI